MQQLQENRYHSSLGAMNYVTTQFPLPYMAGRVKRPISPANAKPTTAASSAGTIGRILWQLRCLKLINHARELPFLARTAELQRCSDCLLSWGSPDDLSPNTRQPLVTHS